MNPNIPGLRTGSAAYQIPTPTRAYEYDHVPLLRELLPQLRGVPGFYYLQVAVENQRRAQDEGWQPVANSVVYSVLGPKGSVDVSLFCFGRPIPGAGYRSGKRTCLVDLAIFERTGLSNEPTEDTPVGDEPEPTMGVASSGGGTTKVPSPAPSQNAKPVPSLKPQVAAAKQ